MIIKLILQARRKYSVGLYICHSLPSGIDDLSRILANGVPVM